MIGFHIEHHRHGRGKAEERIAVLACFQNNGVPRPHPMGAVDEGKHAADHQRRIGAVGKGDAGSHGGGGGFAVRAGNAQRVAVPAHDNAEGLRTFKHRDASLPGGHDFRVVVMHSRRANHKIGPADIFRRMSDGNRDPHGGHLPHRVGHPTVRPAHEKPLIVKNFGQGIH